MMQEKLLLFFFRSGAFSGIKYILVPNMTGIKSRRHIQYIVKMNYVFKLNCCLHHVHNVPLKDVAHIVIINLGKLLITSKQSPHAHMRPAFVYWQYNVFNTW